MRLQRDGVPGAPPVTPPVASGACAAVGVGEDRGPAVVVRLEAPQVGGRARGPGAVHGARRGSGRHPLRLLRGPRGEEGAVGAAVVSRGGDLRAVGGGAGTGLPRRPEVLSRGTPGDCIACIAPAVVTGVPAVGGRRVAAPRAVSSVRAAERRSCFGGEIELSETKPLALRGWGRTRSGGFSGALVTVEDGIGRLLVNEARALGLPSPPRNLAGRGPEDRLRGTGVAQAAPGRPR